MIGAAVETFVRLEQWMAIKGAPERPQKILKLVAGGRWA
jgi:hypothetical protein